MLFLRSLVIKVSQRQEAPEFMDDIMKVVMWLLDMD